MKRSKALMMTFYVVCILLYCLTTAICYKLMISIRPYFLFIIIPLLLLFLILFLSTFSKMCLIIFSSVFGKNGNDEVNDGADKALIQINKFTKYSLIALFITFLTTVMILDIILCVNKEKYTLLAISIVVWILLHTLIFREIIILIRNEKIHS